MKNKTFSTTVVSIGVIALLSSGLLVGCQGAGQNDAVSQTTDNSNSSKVLSTDTIEVALNAENKMCNDALTLKVTGIQRRPVSTFAGYRVQGTSTTGKIEEGSTTDVVIEVDISYTWNVNKYTEAVTAAGNTAGSTPSKLKDILKPEDLMVIEGKDGNGDPYLSCNVIIPEEQKDTNQLGINAQWDYDVLNSALPETSQVKTGSMLFRVSSTASDLVLYITTPASGQPIHSGSQLDSGLLSQFSLKLT